MANMIFQHTWQQVVDGTKTQTRRIVKPNEKLVSTEHFLGGYQVSHVSRRDSEGVFLPIPYAVGYHYAVMPARGVKGIRKVADIEIAGIRREDVRQISEADAIAEGFGDAVDFWYTWVDMHDKRFYETFAYAADMGYLREYGFFDRPEKYYDAWALTFRVVNVYADAVAVARELLATEAA